VTLEKGDILTLFTDGVTEQENETGLGQVVLNKEAKAASALVAHITEPVSPLQEISLKWTILLW